jgi:hypothetical protein
MSEVLTQLLTRAGLPTTAEDYAHLERYLEVIQPQLAELRLAEFRYAEPAMTFHAEPT